MSGSLAQLGIADGAVSAQHPLRPTPFEIAAGRVYGAQADGHGLTESDGEGDPLAALERAMLPALERPPCMVSFSGGRDSSAVLAVAARLARRQGLEPPVPITLRFGEAPGAEESEWQERVIRHLGLSDWEQREITDEADIIGPISASVLRRHGVLWPANAFLHVPLLEAASPGSLLTGVGGDHIFLTWRWRGLADLLGRRRRPVGRDLMRLGYAAAPPAVRRRVERRRERWYTPTWLRPELEDRVHSLSAGELAEEPVSWHEWVVWRERRRDLTACRWSLGVLADDAGTLLVHPLADPGFVAALGRAGGRFGYGDRTALMRALFDGMLPDRALARGTKAHFNEVFWRAGSLRFAEAWDGGGVDDRLVDPDALRAHWLSEDRTFLSAMLLQAAWLSGQG